VRINAKGDIDAKGTLKGEFTITAEGQSDSNIRRIFTTGWQSQWKNSLESQLLSVSPKAKLLSVDYGKEPKEYQKAPIKITFKYEIPDYAVVGEEEIAFKPIVMNNLYNQVKSYLRIDTSLSERKYGFKDACTRLVELNEVIKVPKGYKMVAEPVSLESHSEAADMNGSLSQTGDKITLDQTLTLKKRVYEASDWDGFRSAVNAHKSFDNYIIVKK
jgi:hypothetical protein